MQTILHQAGLVSDRRQVSVTLLLFVAGVLLTIVTLRTGRPDPALYRTGSRQQIAGRQQTGSRQQVTDNTELMEIKLTILNLSREKQKRSEARISCFPPQHNTH